MQAAYTFPVGVTTLWWYAPANSFSSAFVTSDFESSFFNATAGGNTQFVPQAYVQTNGGPVQKGRFLKFAKERD